MENLMEEEPLFKTRMGKDGMKNPFKVSGGQIRRPGRQQANRQFRGAHKLTLRKPEPLPATEHEA
jgi:hypothetical protein